MENAATTNGNLALAKNQNKVITIPATEKTENVKLRVAAYARVSTASDDQMNSFAAQNSYYTNLITSNENWRMVDIYADGCVKIGLNRAKPCGTRDCAGLVLFLHYHIRRPK